MGNAETGGHIEPISAPITAPMDAVAKKGKKRSKNQSIPVVENNNTSNDLTDSNKLTEEHASSIVNSDNNASVPVTDPTDDYQNNINRRYVNSNATESDIELLKGMEWENRKAMMSYFKALAVQRGKEIYNDSEYRGGKQFRLKCKGCSNFCIIGRERYSKIIPGVKKRSFQLKVRNSSFDHFTMNEDGTKAPCIIVNSGSSETKSRRSLDADGNAPKRRKKSTENAAASSAQRSGTSEEKHGAVKESTIGDASSSDDESKVVEPLPAPIKKRKVRITNLPKQDTETVNSTDSHAGNGTVKETGSASAK